MIFHKPSFHFHVTVGIGTSDNLASTALKVSLKTKEEANKFILTLWKNYKNVLEARGLTKP